MNFYSNYLFAFLISFNSINAMQIISKKLNNIRVQRLDKLKVILTSNRYLHVPNSARQNLVSFINHKQMHSKPSFIQLSDMEFMDLDIKTDNSINFIEKNGVEDKEKTQDFLSFLNPDLNLSKKSYLFKKKAFEKVLLQNPEAIHDSFGKYLLFHAVFNSDYEMVLLLLKLGVDINQTIEIIDGEEIPIMNFADANIKIIIKLYEKYYLKTY